MSLDGYVMISLPYSRDMINGIPQGPMAAQLSTLEAGSTFRCDWRPAGKNVGKVLRQGTGSTLVRVQVIKEDGAEGWEDITWAPTTEVELIDAQEYHEERGGDRNRSTVESPVALVHRLCEELSKQYPLRELASHVVQLATDQGVNISTAKTQFYAWRKKNRG